MESSGTSYLYTLAILGMTFIGFSAIVMLLRQTLGGPLRAFDALFARVYMEFGVAVSIGAMLPPLLMSWDLPSAAVWRLSSGLVGLLLLRTAVTYPARRRAATGERTPGYVRVNVGIIYLISVTLLIDAIGVLQKRAGPTFLAALTAFLIFALVAWLRALTLILVPESR
jgi:hypothetical protein